MNRLRFAPLAQLAAIAATLTVGNEAHAVWTKLIGEGDILPGASSLPGFDAAETIRSNGIRDASVTPNGNVVGFVSTNPDVEFGDEAWYVYGSDDQGATVGALRREGVYDGETQTTISTSGIANNGEVFYRARLASAGGPAAVYRDDDLIFQEGDQIVSGPLAGNYFSDFFKISKTPDGVETWTSDYAESPGGPVIGNALFRGTTDLDVLIGTGDSVGSGLTVEPEGVDGNLRWSALGTNYLAPVKVEQNPSPNPNLIELDQALVINGQAVTLPGGGVLKNGEAIPAAVGGLPNETWSIGSEGAINEAGNWAHSAAVQINGQGNSTASVLVVDGVIRHRVAGGGAPPTILDGRELSGSPSSISLNDRGDIAFVWNNALFLNDEVLIEPGDLIDTTGDGVGDAPINFIFDVTLTNLPSADGGPLLYFEGRTGTIEFLARNTPVSLEGDYNGDGVVDAADYTVWRDTDGSTLLLGADSDDANFVVDDADRVAWAAAYGDSSAPSAAIPEPSAIVIALAAGLVTARRR